MPGPALWNLRLRGCSQGICILQTGSGNSLVIQWLRLHAPKTGSLGSIPGQGLTKSCMSHLRILHATTKTGHRKIHKFK